MAFDEHVEETGASNYKTKNWCCICYTEHMREDWRESIEDIIDVPGYYGIHDKDVDSKGKPRKEHIHLSIYWTGNINRKAAKNIANRLSKPGEVCCPVAQPITNTRRAYDYAIHDTEKAQKDGKFLYPESYRVCFNGFDIGFFEQLSQEDRDRMAHEIAMMIHDRKIMNMDDLSDIINKERDFSYFQVFKGQNAFFDRLCRGVYLKSQAKGKKKAVDCEAYEPARVAMSEAPLHDQNGNRVLVCRDCGHVGEESDFLFWGGENGPNIGKCRFCE